MTKTLVLQGIDENYRLVSSDMFTSHRYRVDNKQLTDNVYTSNNYKQRYNIITIATGSRNAGYNAIAGYFTQTSATDSACITRESMLLFCHKAQERWL